MLAVLIAQVTTARASFTATSVHRFHDHDLLCSSVRHSSSHPNSVLQRLPPSPPAQTLLHGIPPLFLLCRVCVLGSRAPPNDLQTGFSSLTLGAKRPPALRLADSPSRLGTLSPLATATLTAHLARRPSSLDLLWRPPLSALLCRRSPHRVRACSKPLIVCVSRRPLFKD